MLFRCVYDALLLLILIIALPFVIYQRMRFGKYKSSLWQRLGIKLPSFQKKNGDQVIWIHSISLGEAKAASAFFQEIQKKNPQAKIIVSATTETGMAEAKKGMKGAEAYFFLPWDFSWNMRILTRRISPDLLILVESDLWYHLLYWVKRRGGKTLLINGKLSERSFKRFRRTRFFFRKISHLLDHLCVQSNLYKQRFILLGTCPSKIDVTGNIKVDAQPSLLSEKKKNELLHELALNKNDHIVTLGSTHYPEEEMILTVLQPLMEKDPHLKILICPRHIERCNDIESLLIKKRIKYVLFSNRTSLNDSSARVIIIDAFGILTDIYQISHLALVCGSFTDTVGGHNIYEPILYGVAVFFGPHMYSQRDLRDLVKPSGAGRQVSLEDLSASVERFFANEGERKAFFYHCLRLQNEAKGALQRTLDSTDKFL